MMDSKYLVIELDDVIEDYCVAIDSSFVLTINSLSIVPIIISTFLEKPIETVCLDFICHWLYDSEIVQPGDANETQYVLRDLTLLFICNIKNTLLINGITDYESGRLSLYKLTPRNTIIFERFT